MRLVKIADYRERAFQGIEWQDMLKRRIRANPSWENLFFLGMHWTEYCRFFHFFGHVYLQCDVSQRTARWTLRRALRKSPENARVLAAIGFTYVLHCPKPPYPKVSRFFQRAHQCAPREPFYALCAQAGAYMTGQYAQAAQLCEGILETAGNDEEIQICARLTAAFACVQAGECERAQKRLAEIQPEALRKLPNPEWSLWDLLEAYYCAEAPEKARQIYEACHAGDIPVQSPCANCLKNGIEESAEEYARNRKAILRYYNPIRNLDFWNRLAEPFPDIRKGDFPIKKEG